MSAYALPGLFPPIETMPSSTNGTKTIDDSHGTSSQPSNERKMPLHLQDDESSSSNIGCFLNSAAIAVKEAKIDPVRWIEYVTGSSPQQYAHQIGKTLRRRAGYDSPTGTKPKLGFGNSANSSNNKSKSQQNEAIEFELAITFKGRRYTAKRTMQCIMQLRDDLIREMNRPSQWLKEPQDMSHLRFSQPSYFSSSKGVTKKQEQDSSVVQIPEIPPFSSDHYHSGDTGFVGKGFLMLHAMVKSYVPVMEGWLQSVMEIVPQDSECLMNFLWEPATETACANFKSVLDSVNSNDDQMISNSKKFKSSTSLVTLGSIKEMDDDAGDESEDDSGEYWAATWSVKENLHQASYEREKMERDANISSTWMISNWL